MKLRRRIGNPLRGFQTSWLGVARPGQTRQAVNGWLKRSLSGNLSERERRQRGVTHQPDENAFINLERLELADGPRTDLSHGIVDDTWFVAEDRLQPTLHGDGAGIRLGRGQDRAGGASQPRAGTHEKEPTSTSVRVRWPRAFTAPRDTSFSQ